jgi:AraC-like DNA-binding protein
MKKYEKYNIQKEDIADFKGLGKEVFFAPRYSYDMLPLDISMMGITNPDPDYYIKRDSSRCFILEYIVSGKGYLCVNGKNFSLEAGDSYLIHPGDKCEYYSDKTDPYKKYWCNFRSYFYADFLNTYDLGEPRVLRGLNLEQTFKRLFELENVSDANDDIYLLASDILYSAAFKIAMHIRKFKTHSSLAAQIKYELQHSIDVPITLEILEEKFYRTKSDIIKQFKKAYGITPYAYLMNLRIQAAKNLLANTRKSAKEISEYLCFSSEYHFSNFFKSKTGISPREYRKNTLLHKKNTVKLQKSSML